jgi:hypothetical protein
MHVPTWLAERNVQILKTRTEQGDIHPKARGECHELAEAIERACLSRFSEKAAVALGGARTLDLAKSSRAALLMAGGAQRVHDADR